MPPKRKLVHTAVEDATASKKTKRKALGSSSDDDDDDNDDKKEKVVEAVPTYAELKASPNGQLILHNLYEKARDDNDLWQSLVNSFLQKDYTESERRIHQLLGYIVAAHAKADESSGEEDTELDDPKKAGVDDAEPDDVATEEDNAFVANSDDE